MATAVALRVFRLGAWGLEGDEINTLRDSLKSPSLNGPKPLLFWLNYHVVGGPFDEITLRTLPLVFGVAGVLAAYVVGRTTLGTRSGLLAALLVAISPWHVYWSQFARYYTLVFLLAMIYPIALAIGVQRRRTGWIITGIVCLGLAILAHPSSGLLLGGLGVFAVGGVALRAGTVVGRLASPRNLAIACVGLVLLWFVSVKLIGELQFWYNYPQSWGHRGPALVLSYLATLSPLVVLFGTAGVVWMWQSDERNLAALFTAIVVVPIAALFLLSYIVPVSTAYLFATAPVWFITAGYFLARCSELGGMKWQSRLIGAVFLLAVVANDVPSLIAHYRDGSRLDFRGAAAYLTARVGPTDVIASDQHRLLGHYLQRVTIRLSRDPATLDTLRPRVGTSVGGDMPALWIVAAMTRRGGFNEQDLGLAAPWVRSSCRLSEVLGRSRPDYRHNEVQIYECRRPHLSVMSPSTKAGQ